MKIITITSSMVLAGLLLFATPLFAQTYQYVTSDSDLQLVVADTPSEAITQAPQRDPHSGVMEVSIGGEGNAFAPIVESSFVADMEVYAYVTVANAIGTVLASNPMEAIVTADNRMSNSGVILVAE